MSQKREFVCIVSVIECYLKAETRVFLALSFFSTNVFVVLS